MTMKNPKACKKCSILSEGEDRCPACGGELSNEWQGYVHIIDPERSEIAHHIGIKAPGRYALRVR